MSERTEGARKEKFNANRRDERPTEKRVRGLVTQFLPVCRLEWGGSGVEAKVEGDHELDWRWMQLRLEKMDGTAAAAAAAVKHADNKGMINGNAVQKYWRKCIISVY